MSILVLIVLGSRGECLRGHVTRSAGSLGLDQLGHLGRAQVQHLGHTQVRYLATHVGGQEDVVGREVTVDYWGRVLV